MSATDKLLESQRNGYPAEWDLTGPPTLADPEAVKAYHKANSDDPMYKAMQGKLSEMVEEKHGKKKKPEKEEPEEQSDFAPEEPVPYPVDGLEVAEEIEKTLTKYLVLPDHAPTAITLWILFSYRYDCFDCCPILAIVSPEKRCGKTTLLALLIALCQKVLSASNITPAATFRAIEKWHPTLIVDEADTFLKQHDELRGILNSGHTSATAFVTRAVQKGKQFDVQRFSTWTPKAIALIGELPDTLADRSITVKMRRKRTDEVRARVPYSRLTDELAELRAKIARWATDTEIKYEAKAPSELDDRAADNWLPLLSIAKAIGWADKANKAALTLSGETDTDTIRTELLADIQNIFENDTDRDAIPTKELLRKLCDLEEKPWSVYHSGNELSGRGLSKLLKPFGISSDLIRFPDGPARGYTKNSFSDAFTRYLSVTRVTSLQDKDLQPNLSVTRNNGVTDKSHSNSLGDNDVTDVTDRIGGAGGKQQEFDTFHNDKAPF